MKQVVCITGVAGGIGSATANIFARNGWYVVGVDCVSKSFLNSEVEHYIRADIGDAEAIKTVFGEISQLVGRLDALVNNAAVQLVKPIVDTEPDEWDSLMKVNVRAPYLAIKYGYPLLRINGGSIVNVSSIHALATSDSMAAYAASKAALVAITRAAAIELALHNIRVNAVLPGAIDTEMLRAGLARYPEKDKSFETRLKSLGARHVIGRIGQPEEIGEAILFLANDRGASFITGQTLIVDGGALARLSTE